jgi:hypothetical protein
VHEHVFAAFAGLNEPIALLRVKPLYGTTGHAGLLRDRISGHHDHRDGIVRTSDVLGLPFGVAFSKAGLELDTNILGKFARKATQNRRKPGIYGRVNRLFTAAA